MSEPITQLRALSAREKEQLELRQQDMQETVDKVDEEYGEIFASCAMIRDFHTALVKQDIPHSVAYGLIPAAVKLYLARRK